MSNANQNYPNHNSDQRSQNGGQQHDGQERLDTGTASANTFLGGFQAIATAYGDYTKKSFEDTKSFVEKLSGVSRRRFFEPLGE
jgi:hypothetical protein